MMFVKIPIAQNVNNQAEIFLYLKTIFDVYGKLFTPKGILYYIGIIRHFYNVAE